MLNSINDLIPNFFIGGLITASISFIGTFFSPSIAALWWAFPATLLPSLYYMHQQGKSLKYISYFSFLTSAALIILFFTTLSLGYFYKNTKSFWKPIVISSGIWLILSIIFFIIFHYWDLKKYI